MMMMMMMVVFSCSRLALVHAVGEKREASGAGHSKVAGAYRRCCHLANLSLQRDPVCHSKSNNVFQ